MKIVEMSQTRESFHNSETIAPGECREIHISPDGELGMTFVTPIQAIVETWGYALTPEECDIDPALRYLLIVGPIGTKLMRWTDES